MSVDGPPLPESFTRVPLAHRALHDLSAGRPENSRAAIRAAVAAGYGVEVDIEPSSDGVAMVFHDRYLKRLTAETGHTAKRTAAELGSLALLGTEETIPTLAEALMIVDGAVPVLIEIKDQDGELGPSVGPLEEAVATAIKDYHGDVAVMSFNPHSVAAMAKLAPQTPRGLVTSSYNGLLWNEIPTPVRDRLRGIPDLIRTGASFISHERHDLARPRVAELRTANYAVLTWTVRSESEERHARRFADNITFENYAPALPA